jgi:UDP-N-acetylmuramyl-tripeptide synthetase
LASVAGRFERIEEGQPFQVIVDYAHTPAGLETVLQAARELTSRRLLCVFGCGGDRDTGKRPMMGRVAEALADRIYLTSDNPRSESPRQIMDQIAAGMQSADRVVVEPDRRQAIHAALRAAAAGDVVVLAGKGDEPYQILDAGQVVPFDDRDVARQALSD